MAPNLKTLVNIPTLSSLYRNGKLKPSQTPDLPNANKKLNDTVCTLQYDITKLEIDAIVNAANRSLLGGGGVDGAIHAAAGDGLYDECKQLRGCDTGSAKITGGHNLPCKKVVHAVGPVYRDDETSEPLLRGCYRTALQLAVDNDCNSIAFSAISTGVYGYPSDKAATVAIREVRKFLSEPRGKKLDKVIFCSFMQKDVDAYAKILPEIFPPTKEDLESTKPSGEYTSSPKSPGNLPTAPSTPKPATSELSQTSPDRTEAASASDRADTDAAYSVDSSSSQRRKVEGESGEESKDSAELADQKDQVAGEVKNPGDDWERGEKNNRDERMDNGESWAKKDDESAELEAKKEQWTVQHEDRKNVEDQSNGGLWTREKRDYTCEKCGHCGSFMG